MESKLLSSCKQLQIIILNVHLIINAWCHRHRLCRSSRGNFVITGDHLLFRFQSGYQLKEFWWDEESQKADLYGMIFAYDYRAWLAYIMTFDHPYMHNFLLRHPEILQAMLWKWPTTESCDHLLFCGGSLST